ncbi:hypothetical protein MRB53_042003 [Persea americana]|nr:hypothetical protein MRB53_042003 [Persea americana]
MSHKSVSAVLALLALFASPAVSHHLHVHFSRFALDNCAETSKIQKDDDLKPGHCKTFDEHNIPAFHSFNVTPHKHDEIMQTNYCYVTAYTKANCEGASYRFPNMESIMGECMNFAPPGRSVSIECESRGLGEQPDSESYARSESTVTVPVPDSSAMTTTSSLLDVPYFTTTFLVEAVPDVTVVPKAGNSKPEEIIAFENGPVLIDPQDAVGVLA